MDNVAELSYGAATGAEHGGGTLPASASTCSRCTSILHRTRRAHAAALSKERIVLGVGGGIAAYKSAELVRRLRDQGAEVRVVMTAGGREFITPLTLQALSGNPVHLELLDSAAEAAMGHIELARWADLVLIAPATADLMARLAQGLANDLLSTLVLATDAPVALAPAMNQAMWRDPATQANAAPCNSAACTCSAPAPAARPAVTSAWAACWRPTNWPSAPPTASSSAA